MKPLRKGAVRTALAKEIQQLIEDRAQKPPQPGETSLADQIAAIIGGALEQSMLESGMPANKVFWKIFGHNLWNLIRSLRASNQLEKV